MKENQVAFRVTALDASVPEGVPIEWHGRELASGPLAIELDLDSSASRGVLDYSRRRAQAEFHVRLKFPEFAATLAALGIDPALGEPVRVVLRSEGDILDDHGFALSGRCELRPHELLDGARAAVLPGH